MIRLSDRTPTRISSRLASLSRSTDISASTRSVSRARGITCVESCLAIRLVSRGPSATALGSFANDDVGSILASVIWPARSLAKRTKSASASEVLSTRSCGSSRVLLAQNFPAIAYQKPTTVSRQALRRPIDFIPGTAKEKQPSESSDLPQVVSSVAYFRCQPIRLA